MASTTDNPYQTTGTSLYEPTRTGTYEADVQATSGKRKSGSAFSWSDNSTGALVGAAVAGAAVGLAANYGRKFIVQATSGASGQWDEALATEHEMVLALFDKLEATSDSDTGTRAGLLAKIKYALTKHAIQEEMVIYPALRQANEADDADELNSEHGYVKTYLYELENMSKDDPQWLARARDFRTLLEEHIRDEEDEIFPALRAKLSEEQNAKLTQAMNKEGFKHA